MSKLLTAFGSVAVLKKNNVEAVRVTLFLSVQDANRNESYVHVHPASIDLPSHRAFDPGAKEGLPANHNRYVPNNNADG